MKQFLLVINFLLIYLLSSVSNIPILEPSKWLSMKFTHFTVHFDKLFDPNGGFYDLYEVRIFDPHFLAHKMSHFLFFGMLALLLLWNLQKWKHSYLFAWLFTTVYGLFDELHQFANPGRTGTIQDVGVDSLSSMIWLTSFYLLHRIYTTQKQTVFAHGNN